MTVFITIIFTLAVVIGLAVFGIWYFWDDITRQQAQIDAWRKAWETMQVEYDTEQRLREATRTAMNQMLGEVRKAQGDA
ncbi:MAG: hypothetical protein FWF21_12885 [Micrococcales bacterium]|nr:hypothetical protein [Micrococcales bacterium]